MKIACLYLEQEDVMSDPMHQTMTTHEALALASMSTKRHSKWVQKVQAALQEEPRLEDTTNAGVVEQQSGLFKQNTFHLIGAVDSSEDKQIVEEITRRILGPKAHIENELSVTSSTDDSNKATK